MTKNQRECQNGGESWDDLIYRMFLPNNVSNETSIGKADKRDNWVLQPNEIFTIGQKSVFVLRLLYYLHCVCSMQNKTPWFFFLGIWNCSPMCQGTLLKGHTGRQWQWQNPVLCSSCSTTKEVDLYGKSLINCKFDHILSFLDSIEPVQNLCILSGLKW